MSEVTTTSVQGHTVQAQGLTVGTGESSVEKTGSTPVGGDGGRHSAVGPAFNGHPLSSSAQDSGLLGTRRLSP